MSKKLSPFVIGAEGNISCRVDKNFYIKGSGRYLSNLSKKDLVLCDEFGKPKNSNSEPSIETGFHSWLFKNLEIDFIAHTHPINTLKILCSDEIYNFSKSRLFPDQVVFNGIESCVVEYFHPGEELLEGIKKSVNNYFIKYNTSPKLILLKNHGIITFGKNINECILGTEMCEKSSEIYLGSLNKPNYLSDYDINKIANDSKEKYRQKLLNEI